MENHKRVDGGIHLAKRNGKWTAIQWIETGGWYVIGDLAIYYDSEFDEISPRIADPYEPRS